MERVGTCVVCVDEGQMGSLPVPEQHLSLAKGRPGQFLAAMHPTALAETYDCTRCSEALCQLTSHPTYALICQMLGCLFPH